MGKMQIRIAHIIGKWLGGGVEAIVMNYYCHIDRNKIQFDFICDEDSTHIPYDKIEELGGRVILVPPYQKIFKYQKELIRIFKENKYQIVHSHINTLSVFPLRAAKKAGIPVRIAHSHSTTNKKEWKKNILKQLLRPFSRKYATDYMCCSEYAGRWLFGNKLYDQGKVYLLNNAIDIEKFAFNEEIRKKKRAELGIDEDTFVVGHVGRFVAQKNHVFLIDIFYDIQKNIKNSCLLLVGDGPLKQKIEEKCNKLGIEDKIRFVGNTDRVEFYYTVMDAFVFPSLYEGLGMTLIEAQANGLNCFASDFIPQVTKVNSNVDFISLSRKANYWANEIIKKQLIKLIDYRSCNKSALFNSIYDIRFEASKLLCKYVGLIRREYE